MAMTLDQCHESFQRKVNAAAIRCGKTPDAVYALWRQYSDACYDQSAIWWEFENNYADKLMPACGFKVVRCVDGRLVADTFKADEFLPSMAALGYKPNGWNRNERQRDELQGAPVFCGLYGPAWDGGVIRYEDRDAHRQISA